MSSCSAITESLKLLTKTLQLAEKATSTGKSLEDSPHLEILVKQISGLAQLPTKQLSSWVTRVVVGSPADKAAQVETNTSLLRKFVEGISKEEW